MKYRDGVTVELEDRVIVYSFGIPMEASVVFISSPMRSINGYEWLASNFSSECIAIRWENQAKAQELYWPSAEIGEMADFLITDSDDEEVIFVSRAIN
ncbi:MULTISPECIES: hypothetical protein [Pseudomonas]|uniref:Uncharacterized protein n=1 Tax=Phytopseudomonas flavescens TaxID=29435 RepID=A0A7Z0BRK5_9GAMM|nr:MULTISPECIES: hypothetical protein [Pseudomonas]MCW2291096.1 hypothetical protein [Pseudomonas sp. BIGb0408]NYH74333.1 hypothetical protein [Pseudomonas flavescens]